MFVIIGIIAAILLLIAIIVVANLRHCGEGFATYQAKQQETSSQQRMKKVRFNL